MHHVYTCNCICLRMTVIRRIRTIMKNPDNFQKKVSSTLRNRLTLSYQCEATAERHLLVCYSNTFVSQLSANKADTCPPRQHIKQLNQGGNRTDLLYSSHNLIKSQDLDTNTNSIVTAPCNLDLTTTYSLKTLTPTPQYSLIVHSLYYTIIFITYSLIWF